MNKLFAGIFLTLIIFVFTACGNSETSNQNFSATLKNTFQVIGGVKSDLSQAAENLSANDSENTSANLKQIFDISKEKISAENAKLTNAEVPENFSASNQKILECLKIEYNLMDRLKENLSVQNEYEAADNFSKSKELFTNLKEQSALLNVDGNNFEEVFDLSSVCQKIENYFNAKKQLRYEKDSAEQAKKDAAAAAAEQAKQRAEAQRRAQSSNDIFCGVGGVTGWSCYAMPDTFRRYNGVGDEYCMYTATLKMITQSGDVKYLDYTIHVGNFPAWFENSQGFKGRISSETNVEQGLLNCLLNHYGD